MKTILIRFFLFLAFALPAFGYLDPETGEFLTADPAGDVDGPNLYTYVRQNPWSAFDPEGLATEFNDGTTVNYHPKSGYQVANTGTLVGPGPINVAAANWTLNRSNPNPAVVEQHLKAIEKFDPYSVAAAMGDPYTRAVLVGAGLSTHRIMGNENEAQITIRGKSVAESESTSPTPGAKSAKAIAAESEAEATKVITIDQNKYPEATQHLEEAGALNKPLTVDRGGASARRAAALKGIPTTPENDRDEAPPAVFKEGSKSVKSITSGDNRGAGASIGNQLRGVKDNETVILKKKSDQEK